MSRTSFNSTHEAYAYILEEFEKTTDIIGKTKTDLSFLWMNITRGNFEDTDKQTHALKELGYLAHSSYALADSAARLSNLSRALIKHIEGEIQSNVE